MKHTRTKKILLTLTMLTLCCAAAFSASAEENGYWTMQHDETGLPIMVYTYTEKVEFIVSDTGNIDPAPTTGTSQTAPDAVLSSSGELPARMAGQYAASDLSGAKDVSDTPSLLVLSLGGALFLTGLGYALYRAL